MLDWDKIVVEVDNNTVDLTAGEVALLIAADADTVTWGNITGDYTQQSDLMLAIDSKVDIDSPEFTGTPRTPTPPAGNVSNRIANTEFVDTAIDAAMDTLPEFGALASKDKVDFRTDVTNKPSNTPSSFGSLASKSSVNYETEITNKPTLGALADHDLVDYRTEVSHKPTLGTLASKDSVDYQTEVTNKPSLGALASKDTVNYATEVTNKPALGNLAYQNAVDYNSQVSNKPPAVMQDNIASQFTGYEDPGSIFFYNNNLYRTNTGYSGASTPFPAVPIKLANELSENLVKIAPYFNIYGYYKVGDYVRYNNTIYRFIFEHNTGDWSSNYVTETGLAHELSTGELKIYSNPSIGDPTFTNLDTELRSAGAHAITYIELNSSATTTHTCKSITISGHKRITVEATRGNIAYFNGEYNTYIPNKFYSIIVEDGAILELIGNITVYNQASNGILIRRGGTVIYRSVNSGEKLTINIPSINFHDAVRVESGGKFICEGELYATRGAAVYPSYPCYPVNVQYGGEAHVNKITSSSSQFNAAIGCTGGIASYKTLSGLKTVDTSAGGRVFTGSQS